MLTESDRERKTVRELIRAKMKKTERERERDEK